MNDFEVQFATKSGEVRDLRGSIELLELGGQMCLLWQGHDVTEQKQAQRDRERFINELEARNAELERFAYTISHEVKSPLFTITGFLGLLQQDASIHSSEKLTRFVQEISAATETMNQLLDELIDISRIGRVEHVPEEIHLDDLIQEAIQSVHPSMAERGIEVSVAPALPLMYGDRQRLAEVLHCLVENAVKFMGDQSQPHIKVGVRTDCDDVVYFVQDNGMGIEPRYHERVFRLFERLDAGSNGTGVGLALAKRIVEVHGGRIWVESEGTEKGSTFCFTLSSPPS